jgi:hypothetical protein
MSHIEFIKNIHTIFFETIEPQTEDEKKSIRDLCNLWLDLDKDEIDYFNEYHYNGKKSLQTREILNQALWCISVTPTEYFPLSTEEETALSNQKKALIAEATKEQFYTIYITTQGAETLKQNYLNRIYQAYRITSPLTQPLTREETFSPYEPDTRNIPLTSVAEQDVPMTAIPEKKPEPNKIPVVSVSCCSFFPFNLFKQYRVAVVSRNEDYVTGIQTTTASSF